MQIISIIIHLTIFVFSLTALNVEAEERSLPITFIDKIQQQRIYEPIFGGATYIYEAGKDHSKSIILVHGIGDEAASIWIKLMKMLAQSYHVVAFDLPGFGKSDIQNVLYSPDKYSKFIKWIKDSKTTGPVIILGHSLGGALALHFAATYPDLVESLIIIDAVGILHRAAYSKDFLHIKENENWPWLINKSLEKPFRFVNKLTGKTIEKMESEDSSIQINTILNNEFLRMVFLGGKPSAIAGLAVSDFDFSELIEKVTAPTLIIWGENDSIAPIRTAKILTAKLKRTHLEIIQQTGHAPMVESPKIFNQKLLKFIANPFVAQLSTNEKTSLPNVDRKGLCKNQSELSFTGNYKEIEINNCKEVKIENLTAENILITDSEVILENCVIVGMGVGLKTARANIVATNITVRNDTAIYASSSRLDIAGGEIVGKEAAIVTPDNSFIIFSLGHIKSPYTDGHIHGIKNLTPENPL